MKKLILFIISIFVILSFTSCTRNRVLDIKNVVWKEENFNIVATYEQLYNQSYGKNKDYIDKYYSTMTFDGKDYFCRLSFWNELFDLKVYEFTENNVILSMQNCFLDGSSKKIKKAKNEEYRYYFDVVLYDENYYYDYCIKNNIVFPEKLTFYGYEI